jgi:cytidine deaminase
MPKKVQLTLNVDVYQNDGELDKDDFKLLETARQICENAYAPYSNFFVGAAIVLDDGTVCVGTNQENAAFPSGLCAERTAIFAASAQYPNKIIKTIAIAARPAEKDTFLAISPCGACRQVMSEYEYKQKSPIRFIMQGKNESIYILNSVDDLLPIKFTADSLVNF